MFPDRPSEGNGGRRHCRKAQRKSPCRCPPSATCLSNPFYYGVFLHKGELHQGTHAPMISKQTFDDIQKALVAVGKPRQASGTTRVSSSSISPPAGHAAIASPQSGTPRRAVCRFHYYRCTHKNKKQHCDDRSFVREEKFAEEVKRNAPSSPFPTNGRRSSWPESRRGNPRRTRPATGTVDRLKAELASLKSKIDRLNNAFTEGALELAGIQGTEESP